jgi:hypothetical protein
MWITGPVTTVRYEHFFSKQACIAQLGYILLSVVYGMQLVAFGG